MRSSADDHQAVEPDQGDYSFQSAGRCANTAFALSAERRNASLIAIAPSSACVIGAFMSASTVSPSGTPVTWFWPFFCQLARTSSMCVPLKRSAHLGSVPAQISGGQEIASSCGPSIPSLVCRYLSTVHAASTFFESDSTDHELPATRTDWRPDGPFGGGAKSRFCNPMSFAIATYDP